MPSVKRSNSAANLGAVQNIRSKSVKLEQQEEVPVQVDDELTQLKAQIAELHGFIIKNGLNIKATESIRKQLEAYPGAEQRLDEAIRHWIQKAYKKLDQVLVNHYADEFSKAMAVFIPEIQRLSEMPAGLELAFHTIIDLGNHSYGSLSTYDWSAYGERPSDGPADALLVKLSKRMKNENPDFEFDETQRLLKDEVDRLRSKGIETFFPASYELMWSFVQGPEAVRSVYDACKLEITETHERCVKDMCATKSRPYRHSCDLSSEMTKFIPTVQRLSNMEGGQHLAFDLILYLGRQSYTEMAGRSSSTYRESDQMADKLLLEIAKAIKENEEYFLPLDAIERLKNEIEYLAEYKITTYFSKSFALFSSWVPNLANEMAEDYMNEVKTKIQKAHKTQIMRLKVSKSDGMFQHRIGLARR
ncbi:hypothetical protein DL98DRAFT_187028 [Cadophora sp. DSE1049]|nr:hypothetical protein DL98DRAFT_187028 [Cadophora sp. DSE1049]